MTPPAGIGSGQVEQLQRPLHGGLEPVRSARLVRPYRAFHLAAHVPELLDQLEPCPAPGGGALVQDPGHGIAARQLGKSDEGRFRKRGQRARRFGRSPRTYPFGPAADAAAPARPFRFAEPVVRARCRRSVIVIFSLLFSTRAIRSSIVSERPP